MLYLENHLEFSQRNAIKSKNPTKTYICCCRFILVILQLLFLDRESYYPRREKFDFEFRSLTVQSYRQLTKNLVSLHREQKKLLANVGICTALASYQLFSFIPSFVLTIQCAECSSSISWSYIYNIYTLGMHTQLKCQNNALALSLFVFVVIRDRIFAY